MYMIDVDVSLVIRSPLHPRGGAVPSWRGSERFFFDISNDTPLHGASFGSKFPAFILYY